MRDPIQLTNDRREVVGEDDLTFGTIVVSHGLSGTAYQRFFSDGLFHGTNGKVKTVHQMLAEPDVYVVHTPPSEEEEG